MFDFLKSRKINQLRKTITNLQMAIDVLRGMIMNAEKEKNELKQTIKDMREGLATAIGLKKVD